MYKYFFLCLQTFFTVKNISKNRIKKLYLCMWVSDCKFFQKAWKGEFVDFSSRNQSKFSARLWYELRSFLIPFNFLLFLSSSHSINLTTAKFSSPFCFLEVFLLFDLCLCWWKLNFPLSMVRHLNVFVNRKNQELSILFHFSLLLSVLVDDFFSCFVTIFLLMPNFSHWWWTMTMIPYILSWRFLLLSFFFPLHNFFSADLSFCRAFSETSQLCRFEEMTLRRIIIFRIFLHF